MYGSVALTTRSIDDYGALLGPSVVDELRELAQPLRGARVLHLNLSAFGTGVADLLSASVPLLVDLGLDAHWQVIRTTEEFGHVTSALYAALSGTSDYWSNDLTQTWLRYCRMNASLLDEPFDYVVVHDPQPAGICGCGEATPARVGKWIWHCHMDLSHTLPEAWHPVHEQVEAYDAIVFATPAFLPERPPVRSFDIIRPCIDPLGPRNMDIAEQTVASLLERYGIDTSRPIVAQISPIDEHNDPLGAIDAFLLAREELPELQMVLVATPISEDAMARDYYERVSERSARLPDVHLLSGLNDVGNVEVNVLQRAASVIVQRRLQLGFGIWIAEAQWKRQPIVASPEPGVLDQITPGETGLTAKTSEEFAQAIVRLIRDRSYARRLGEAAHASARERFLLPRYLADHLRLLNRLQAAPMAAAKSPPGAPMPASG